MNDLLLSIIIPVYNVEKYLSVCVQSVLKCNADIEIILIDDGSTDKSGEICDLYADFDNVTVIHQPNGGLSDARNTGLRYAKGKYLFFLDSDDYVTDRAIDNICQFLYRNPCEVLLFDANVLDESGENMIEDNYYFHGGLKEEIHYTGRRCIEEQLKHHNDYVTTVWLGVYRKEFLLSNYLWFEKGLLHEDEMWTQKVLFSANDICYLDRKLYCYRQRSYSITDTQNKNNRKNISDLIYIFSAMLIYVDWKIEDSHYRKMIKANIVRRYLHAIAKFEVWRYPDLKRQIDKRKIFANTSGVKDKLRAFILLINIHLYCILSKLK